MTSMRNNRGCSHDIDWATTNGLSFASRDSVRVDIFMKMSEAPFNYYIVCRDDSQVVQGFYDVTAEVIENGILTLTGRDRNSRVLKVHFPLDFVKHWCQLGPGDRVNNDSQS